MRAAILILALLSGCATHQPEPPVTFWWPEPYSYELVQQVERQAAMCKSEAVKATPSESANQSVIYNGYQQNAALLSLVQQGQAEHRQAAKVAAVFEGCMYERGYRKVVMPREEFDAMIAKANGAAIQ